MLATLDLHIHSRASHDGRMSPAEICALARARGLDGVAICDHDVPFLAELSTPELLVIRGEELSTPWGHLLALFLTGPVEGNTPAALVASIHAQGGLAILAHPFERDLGTRRAAPLLELVDGVEVFNARAGRKNPRANAMATALARERGLVFTAGSDAHLPREIGGGTLTLAVEALTVPAVKAALLAKRATVRGLDGRHVDVARSQLTRLRKKRAPWYRYLKWLAFAAKCLAEDLLRPKSNPTEESLCL